MEKTYKITYHFNDGVSWGEETQDADQGSGSIKYLLDHFANNSNLEMTSHTGETKKVEDLKSIEIHL